MKDKTIFKLLLGSLLLVLGCAKPIETQEAKNNTAAIIEQVKDRVDAFQAADTTLSSDKVIDLLWPEFTMLADGNYLAYQDVKTGSKAFMESLNSFHTKWDDLRIIPLGKNHAISSFIFTDSIVAKDGTLTQSTGPNTFIWEKRDGVWKVLYGDADHYPIK